MTQLYTTTVAETIPVACNHAECEGTVSPDQAVWYNLGISHYNKEKGVSYIQVHTTPYCCSEEHAAAAAHARADGHANIPFGSFDPAILNPNGEHPDMMVQQNAIYSPMGRAWASLPKIDALTGETLGDDVYVVHVDRNSHQAPKTGLHGYHTTTGELASGTLDGAIKLIHVIIDEVLAPAKEATSEN